MRDEPEVGVFIHSIAGIIESYAALDKHPEGTILAILDAVAAELIWRLGDEYDADIIITRHGENIAELLNEMADST